MSCQPSTSTAIENREKKDLFYFESDHLALKGNKDYSDMVNIILTLEAQRAQAIKDIDTIIEVQNVALENPLEFLRKLKNKENLGIPMPQTIAEIPNINLTKYNVTIPEDALKQINQEQEEYVFKPPKRPKNQDNTSTFNKPWSSEEQKKLEELLIKFPPESVEMRRYKKIAEALGNRTVRQVTSRVQKYFLKLYKAGLPIPGRIPKTLDKKRYSHKHQRLNSYLYKSSSFFPDEQVPVYMAENDEDVPGPSRPPSTIEHENSNSSIDEKDEVHLKISLLKRIKMEKAQERNDALPFAHLGYICGVCNETPILGSRWHCNDCNQKSVDFCADCLISQINSSRCHPLSHNLIPIINEESSSSSSSVVNNTAFSTSGSSFPSTVKSEPTSDNDSDSTDKDSDLSSNANNMDNLSEEETEENHVNDCDQDYVSDTFSKDFGKYNYLDPNFFPE